jgi:hypothetical protein
MKASTSVFGFLVGGMLIAPTIAQAAIKLKLTYSDDMTFKIGSLTTSSELDFILAGKDVSVYAVDKGGSRLIASKTTGQGNYYGPVRFRVKTSRNSVDLYGSYKSHVLHTRVTSDGRSSCSASIISKLKRGHSKYEYYLPSVGSIDVYSQRFYDVRCELSTN